MMDLPILLIESVLTKFIAERKWFIQTIEQLDEEDVSWSPTEESNSIANLVLHIRGTVHSRIEILLFDIPDTRDRDKEFEKGIILSKARVLQLGTESFDLIIHYLEQLKSQPDLLLSQPYLNKSPLTYSNFNNETTVVNLLIQMVREIHTHTGQIIYIAKMRKGLLQWKYD